MTQVITGRTMWEVSPRVIIAELHDWNEADALFVLDPAELHTHKETGRWILKTRHVTATDEEHDAAYVAYFEGYGLDLELVGPTSITFTGVLLETRYYTEPPETEPCEDTFYHRDREEPHPIMNFTPPKQTWRPRPVRITFNYEGLGR